MKNGNSAVRIGTEAILVNSNGSSESEQPHWTSRTEAAKRFRPPDTSRGSTVLPSIIRAAAKRFRPPDTSRGSTTLPRARAQYRARRSVFARSKRRSVQLYSTERATQQGPRCATRQARQKKFLASCYSPTLMCAVPSPLELLTTVFGKGTCVSSPL